MLYGNKRLRLLCYLVGLVRDNGDHVGHNEFREAAGRRAGSVDRNKEVVVRLGCEFGPGGPDDLFEDLVALIYMTITFLVRGCWQPWLSQRRAQGHGTKTKEHGTETQAHGSPGHLARFGCHPTPPQRRPC